MDPFLNTFFAIDSSKSEKISVQDLQRYVETNGLPDDMVKRWTRIFDQKNTGKIDLTTICQVFNMPIDAVRAQRDTFIRSGRSFKPTVAELGPDVTIVNAKMPMNQQIWITDTARQLVEDPRGFQREEATKLMKNELDKIYGKAWTVVIIQGSFWINFSHSANASIQFRLGDHSFLVWRTPDEIM